ncbi:acyl-CoA thioesterase [Actinomadura sp. 3N407]|uniref:acyl-CoA thioesterase n=1 Tax=Actinomadura sp. 3N407 TaxID=3457423 RepID=UPI003FCDA0A0
MKSYEYVHTVSFEETNAIGNVYFTHYLRWQGRCREQFVHEQAPMVLDELAEGVAMVTTRCSCEYLAELTAFDRVAVRMRAGDVTQNRLTLLFDYVRLTQVEQEQLVARGEQQLAWMRRDGERLVPHRVPSGLLAAIDAYADTTGSWRR